jgi:hypothetical protein
VILAMHILKESSLEYKDGAIDKWTWMTSRH